MKTHPELPDSQLRSIALEAAIEVNQDGNSTRVLDNARRFYDFLKGDDENKTTRA